MNLGGNELYLYCFLILAVLMVEFLIAKAKPKLKVKQSLIMTVTVVCFVYLMWRLTVIPVHDGYLSFILAVILYIAELLGVLAFFNFQYLFFNKSNNDNSKSYGQNKSYDFTVDVLICTYNEPLDLLEMTIAAATNLEYPKDKLNIYILDDGKRKELEILCQNYGINYLSRDSREGAKAGNINNALTKIKGDLFAVLDADMIPKKDFLIKTVGYFSNENLAFVQTPQVYYNQDMYQYNLMKKNLPNEQDFFMRHIQEARASKNATLHVGTNAVFNRQHVLSIGGYPTDSITEDMAVGMLLQGQGFDSLFVNEELVMGLSATTFIELVKQRDRWCRGNIQVLKHYMPLFNSGLSLGQKIAYLDGGIYWFANIQKMIYIIFPLLYLLTNITMLDCSINSLLCIYLPYAIGQLIIFNVLSSKSRSLKWAHIYEVAMAPHLCISIFKELLNLKIKFNVTAKDTILNKKTFQYQIVISHIFIAILTIIAWILATYRFLNGMNNTTAYLLNIFWSIYNFYAIIIALKVAWQKPILRKMERVLINQKQNVEVIEDHNLITGRLIDISGTGLKMELDGIIKIEKLQIIKFILNKQVFSGQVMRVNNNIIALRYNQLSPKQMQMIMNIFTENMQAYYVMDLDEKVREQSYEHVFKWLL